MLLVTVAGALGLTGLGVLMSAALVLYVSETLR